MTPDSATPRDPTPSNNSSSSGSRPRSRRTRIEPAALPKIPGYQVLEELGQGGMAIVYKALDIQTNTLVAIKMIISGELARPQQLARFEREANVIAQLNHAHIVQFHDFGNHNGRPYIVLEYVSGGSLANVLNGRRMTIRSAVRLIEKIAIAVDVAHQQNIIHRDLKPGNILLTERGEPKVADFGLALDSDSDMTATGVILGTPSHMAPEQAEGKRGSIGPHTDIWSLGVILYECLTGKSPFKGESNWETINRVMKKDPPPIETLNPKVPSKLAAICYRCLEKRPSDRYPSGGELAAALRKFRKTLGEDEEREISDPEGLEFGDVASTGAHAPVRRLSNKSNPILESRSKTKISPPVADAGHAETINAEPEGSAKTTPTKGVPWVFVGVAGTIVMALGLTVLGLALLFAKGNRQSEVTQKNTEPVSPTQPHTTRQEPPIDDPPISPPPPVRRPRLSADRWTHLLRHPGSVLALATAPDGTFATGCMDGTVRIWRFGSQELVTQLRGHKSPVTALVYSKDGKFLASGSEDRSVRIWQLSSGNSIRTIGDHLGTVRGLAYNRDGSRLVTVAEGTNPRLFDSRTGTVQTEFAGADARPFGIALSADDKTLAVAYDDGIARLYDTATGQTAGQLRGHTGAIYGIAADPTNRYWATAGADKSARIWHRSGKLHKELTEHISSVYAISFTLDGQRLATASSDRSVRIYDVEQGSVLIELPGHTDGLRAVGFSPDGSEVASAGVDNTARVWDALYGSTETVLRGHTSGVLCIAYNPQGTMLVTGGDDYTARLWDNSPNQGRVIGKHGDAVRAVAFNRTNFYIATACADGEAKLWTVSTGEAGLQLRGHGGIVTDIAFSQDGQHIVTSCADNLARLFNANGGELERKFSEHRSSVSSISLSKDGTRLLTTSADNTAKLWDVRSGNVLHTLTGHESLVLAGAYDPSGRLVATGSADGLCLLWDARNGTVKRRLRHDGSVRAVAFNSTGKLLATGCDDCVARIYDCETGDKLMELRGHTDSVRGVAFKPDSSRLATASADNTARIWYIQPRK